MKVTSLHETFIQPKYPTDIPQKCLALLNDTNVEMRNLCFDLNVQHIDDRYWPSIVRAARAVKVSKILFVVSLWIVWMPLAVVIIHSFYETITKIP